MLVKLDCKLTVDHSEFNSPSGSIIFQSFNVSALRITHLSLPQPKLLPLCKFSGKYGVVCKFWPAGGRCIFDKLVELEAKVNPMPQLGGSFPILMKRILEKPGE